jgi:hypothetical protein
MTTGSEGGSSSTGYESFLASLCAHFGERTASSPPLFETTAEGLFEAFLGGLAPEHRQHYTCERG